MSMSLQAAAPHLPIMLATPSTEEVCADTLMAAGIVDVVRWPIVAEEIAAALTQSAALRDARRRRAPALADSARTVRA
jgi:BarA-like signal transduction histidine kinase